jgi:long-chain acyl-CoA synthetase
VDPSWVEGPTITFEEIEGLDEAELEPVAVEPDDIVEIVYTSGTTSDPKGVVHRHRNICANLRPFAEEFHRYRFLAAPFQPIRLLNLLPLSHMFGQSMGLFIPPLLGGACVFMRSLSPPEIMETVRESRISVVVAVPRIVEQLQNHLIKSFGRPEGRLRTSGIPSVLERWIRHRRFHSYAGYKFWAIVSGGAPLSEELERFWSSLGILVIQGYGLTEASPIVSLNHPFHAKPGSIGKPVKGQEVKIACDGEILVRGDNVVSEYLGTSDLGQRVSENGWLYTGDLGEFDHAGNLRFKGRKKETIITAEGLNVYPQDVEKALNQLTEVSQSVVVGLAHNDNEEVHAVLVLEAETTDPQNVIRTVNQVLEPYQRIRGWTVWPDSDFPRTPATLKVDRRKILQRIRQMESEMEISSGKEKQHPAWISYLPAKSANQESTEYSKDDNLDLDLGMTSLDRIELLARIQETQSQRLDEKVFARLSTVGEISSWLEESAENQRERTEEIRDSFSRSTRPRWTRTFPVRALRNAVQAALIVPLFKRYIEFSVEGRRHLDCVEPPVIFAANHCSNLDTIALQSALPREWRRRLAPAIRQEYFAAHFSPVHFSLKERLKKSFEYYLACALFNTFPIPQRMGGIHRTLRYAGELVEQGYCLLIFPEGARSEDGRIRAFKAGIGVLATRLHVPVIPVHISGLFEVLSKHDSWPESGRSALRIGPALRFSRKVDSRVAAKEVEKAIRSLGNPLPSPGPDQHRD